MDGDYQGARDALDELERQQIEQYRRPTPAPAKKGPHSQAEALLERLDKSRGPRGSIPTKEWL